MSQKDLVVKMTINSQDFDSGLKNAKSSMNKFKSETLSVSSIFKSAVGGMAKAFTGLGVAMAAKSMFKDFANSTESMKDSWANNIGAMKDSWKAFLFQVNNGNFQGFKDLINYATQARWALDALGDATALFNLDLGQNQAKMTELLSTIQKKKRSGQDYSGDVAEYNKLLASMRSDASISNKAAYNALGALFGKHGIVLGDYGLTPLEAARQARLAAMGGNADVERYRRAMNAKVDTSELNDFDITPGVSPLEQLRKEWGRERFNRAQLLSTLGNITTEEKEGIEKILLEISGRDQTIAQMEKRLNRYLTEENPITGGGGGGAVAVSTSPTMTPEQIAQYWFNDKTPGPLIDIPLLDEDIVEPETDALLEKVAEHMALVADRTQYAMVAFQGFGNVLSGVAELAGDNPFGSIAKGLSGAVGAAASAASALMALAGVETLEGVAEVFSKAPPYLKLAMAATALSGIMAMIGSIKGSFAGSFANGGVVPGNSYTGDQMWARVNSGELIVPYNDWHNANGGNNVHFVIEGSQLRGVLDNYDKTVSL